MSQLHGKTFTIAKEANRECQFCHKMAECRPYGPNGADICYKCANATPEMRKIVDANLAATLDRADTFSLPLGAVLARR